MFSKYLMYVVSLIDLFLNLAASCQTNVGFCFFGVHCFHFGFVNKIFRRHILWSKHSFAILK